MNVERTNNQAPGTKIRVVVRLPNWLGDIVMSLPALGVVRAHFPDATLVAAAPAAFAPVLSAVPGVDETLALAGDAGLRRLRADTAALAAGKFDVAVLFTNSFGSALAVRRAGVPERWGYRSDFRGPLLTRAASRRTQPAGGSRHHSQYYLRLVQALGMTGEPGTARIELPAAWHERAGRLLAEQGIALGSDLVGLAPGAAYGGAKRWPPDRVAGLVRLVGAHTGATCLIVGAPPDRQTGHEIESVLRAARLEDAGGVRLVNLIGRTDLRTLAGVMARCRAFVSNDSGAMHLAAAVGVHVTAVFGPTREWATAPLGPHTVITRDVFCRPCMLRECPIDHRCMTRIDPADVFASVARQLRQGSA